MNKDRMLLVTRILVVLGIILITTAIFIENWDVARLSSLKADKSQLEYDREMKYKIEKPTYPVNESQYVIVPERPASEALEDEKAKYEKESENIKNEKKKLDEKFTADKKKYYEEMKDYNNKMIEFNKEKTITMSDYLNQMKQLNYQIKQKEIDINKMWFPSVFRFIGTLILLLGAVGVLIYGEVYEKLGVLILIGFAFKTIVGL